MENMITFARSSALNAKTLDRALAFGVLYGTLQWANPSKTLNDDEFESILFDKFLKHYKRYPESTSNYKGWLHVVSSSYAMGGHTRLMRFIVNTHAELGESCSVIATQKLDPETSRQFKSKQIPAKVLTGPLSVRLRDLVTAGAKAGCVVLHIHPNDITAALAARLLHERGCPVLFVNHTDHVFSFGTGGTDCVLEVSGYGWAMTEARRKFKKQSFLGIPLESEVFPALEQVTSILSIGSERKFRPSGKFNFPEFLDRILSQTELEADLVGVDGTAEWWSDLKERFGSRVRFHGVLGFDDTRRILTGGSLYIDSFPIPGGSIFSEAFAAGKPVFGVKNDIAGYGLVDSVRSPDLAELEKEVLSFVRSGYFPSWKKELADNARKEFSSLSVTSRLRDARSGKLHELPLEMNMPHPDLDFFVRSSEFTFTLPEKSSISIKERAGLAKKILASETFKSLEMSCYDIWKIFKWSAPTLKKIS